MESENRSDRKRSRKINLKNEGLLFHAINITFVKQRGAELHGCNGSFHFKCHVVCRWFHSACNPTGCSLSGLRLKETTKDFMQILVYSHLIPQMGSVCAWRGRVRRQVNNQSVDRKSFLSPLWRETNRFLYSTFIWCSSEMHHCRGQRADCQGVMTH